MYNMRRVGLFILILVLGVVVFSGGGAFADGEWIFNGPMYLVTPGEVNSNDLWDSVTAKVPDFVDLGVNTIYLQPIFDHTGRSSPYSVVDYYTLDATHGTGTDLQELVTATHNNNMKLIGDLIISYSPRQQNVSQPQGWIYLNHPEWIYHNSKFLSRYDKVSLYENDANYFQVQSADVGGVQKIDWDANTDIDGGTTNTEPSDVTKLQITYDGKYSTSSVTQSLKLWNYNTSQWDTIDTRSVGTTDTTVTWSTLSPQPYISVFGDVKLKIYAEKGTTVFHGGGDWVKFSVEFGGPTSSGSGGPAKVIVNTGAKVDITQLVQDDAIYLQDQSVNVGGVQKLDWDAITLISHEYSLSSATKLQITYNGKYSTTGVTQYLKLWNFTTNQWDTIDTRTVGTTEDTVIWSTTDSATIQKYIGMTDFDGDGQRDSLVNSQVKAKVAAEKTTTPSFDCQGDYLEIWVEPAPMRVTFPFTFGWGHIQDNAGLIPYLTDVAKYYVQNYSFDGWRIDVPQRNYDTLIITDGPHYATSLLSSIKTGITGLNPNAAMYTEYSNPLMDSSSDPLFDEMAEMSYDWDLRPWLLDQATGKAVTNSGGTSQGLVNVINNQVVWYNRGRARILETQDTDRLAYILQNAGRVSSNEPLITLISTLPGTPMIRAGQEVRERNSSGQVDWDGTGGHGGDTTLKTFYKKVFAVRKAHPVLNSGRGTLTNIWTSGTNAIAYARAASGQAPVGDNGVIVLLNAFYENAPNAITFTVSISGLDPNITYQLYDLLTDTYVGTATGSQLGNNYTMNLPVYGKQVIKLIPTASYNCSSATVNIGSIISGDHTNLHANDGSYFQVRAVTSDSLKKIDWDANVTISQAASKVKKLQITYDGKYSASRTQRLSLWNFTTLAWDQIDSRTVGTTDVTVTWSTTDPAVIQKYISGTGEIKLKVYVQNNNSFDGYGDYVQYYVEYTL